MAAVSVRLGFPVTAPIAPLVALPEQPAAAVTLHAGGGYRVSVPGGAGAFRLDTRVAAEHVAAAFSGETAVALEGASGCLSSAQRPVQAYLSPYGKIIFTEIPRYHHNSGCPPWVAVVTLPEHIWAELRASCGVVHPVYSNYHLHHTS